MRKNIARPHHHRPLRFCCCFTRRPLTMSVLLLILSSSTREPYSAEGRTVSGLDRGETKGGGAREVVGQSVIGSSPPRCEGRCRGCNRCAAVQVPVARQVVRGHSVAYYARGDDVSNYKPMTWKCKCGDYLFNP